MEAGRLNTNADLAVDPWDAAVEQPALTHVGPSPTLLHAAGGVTITSPIVMEEAGVEAKRTEGAWLCCSNAHREYACMV